MLLSEFETLTGIYPDYQLWKTIDRAYIESDLDKHEFCACYKANKDGLAHRIQLECTAFVAKEEEKQRKEFEAELEASFTEIKLLHDRIADMKKQLDKELDWQPAKDVGTNMVEDEYQRLADDEAPMTELDAIRRVHQECGFDMAKIRIVEQVHTYEVNKRHETRVKDTYSRPPVWSATDWNYIRFDVAGLQWELVNGELMPYCD